LEEGKAIAEIPLVDSALEKEATRLSKQLSKEARNDDDLMKAH